MSKFTPEQIGALADKLDGSAVKTRQQAGRTLSYIEAWKAIDEANRIFGFDGWNRETISVLKIAEVQRLVGKTNPKDGWGVGYMAKVRITVGDIVREGTGCGSGVDVDLVAAHESAVKEAESDAMKRALMTFGNPFGLALYDKEQANVNYTPDPGITVAAQVNESLDWIKRQTDPQAIHKAWNDNMAWYNGLPHDAQQKLQVARDETLRRIAPPTQINAPSGDAPDAREVWANRQIVSLGKITSVVKIDKWLEDQKDYIATLAPYQRAPLDKAIADARRRLTGISAPLDTNVMPPLDLGDDPIPF